MLFPRNFPFVQTVLAVSSFPSAASRAELSCHICHLLTDDVDVEQGRVKKTISQRTRRSSSDSFLDEADWRVFVPHTLLVGFWGAFFFLRTAACLPARLWQCSGEVNSEGACACSLFFHFWQLCDFFSYCQIFRFGCVVTFHDISPMSRFVVSSKCRMQIVLKITAQGFLQNVRGERGVILQIILERVFQLSKIVKLLMESIFYFF